MPPRTTYPAPNRRHPNPDRRFFRPTAKTNADPERWRAVFDDVPAPPANFDAQMYKGMGVLMGEIAQVMKKIGRRRPGLSTSTKGPSLNALKPGNTTGWGWVGSPGSFGVPVWAIMAPGIRAYFERVLTEHQLLPKEWPADGTMIILKFQNPPDAAHLRDIVHENALHRKLHAYGTMGLCKAVAGELVCAGPITPAFIASGYDAKTNLFVTAMELAVGNTLDDEHPVRWMFTAVENAVHTLWLLGVVHLDLHPDNILVDMDTRSVKIIDFGRSRYLRAPPRTMNNARNARTSATILNAANALAFVSKRNNQASDPHVLRAMFHALSSSDRAALERQWRANAGMHPSWLNWFKRMGSRR